MFITRVILRNYKSIGHCDVKLGPLTRPLRCTSDGKGAGALCVILDLSGTELRACSVHLDEIPHKPRTRDGQVALHPTAILDHLHTELLQHTQRLAAVNALTERLAAAPHRPTLIGGDFNTIPGSRAMRVMSAQFHDALWPSLDDLAGTYRKIRFPCLPRVDYLFASDQVSIEQARVVQQSAGDHYPVVATVSIIASEPERHEAATDSNQAQARLLIQQAEHSRSAESRRSHAGRYASESAPL